MSKWLKLELNLDKKVNIHTFINLKEQLMLHKHFIRGWEIVPNTDDSKIINYFYQNFPNGIKGSSKKDCLNSYKNK